MDSREAKQSPRQVWPRLKSAGLSEADGFFGPGKSTAHIDVPLHPQCIHPQLTPGNNPEAVLEAGLGTGQSEAKKEGLPLALHPFDLS